jgi:hypothetical protein
MRVLVELKDGSQLEGVIGLKDESFLMIKLKRAAVRVFHWEHIYDVKYATKKEYISMNMDVFRKARE